MNTGISAKTVKPVKIPFDSLTLYAVVTELRALLIGGQVQDVRQPTPAELLLGIRSQGRNFLLLLSDDARFARAHLTQVRRPNAPKPPAFCMALRKHVEGGVLRDLRQRGFDRILELEIESRDDAGERKISTLIVEMMGKHSNLILVNETGLILDAAKRITRRVNRVREVLPGVAYQPPPEQADRIDPFAHNAVARLADLLNPQDAPTPQVSLHPTPQPLHPSSPNTLAETLLGAVAGMSPFLASELSLRSTNARSNRDAALREVWESIFGAAAQGRFVPVLVRDTAGRALGAYPFPIFQVSRERQEETEDLNAALDVAFEESIERAAFEAAKAELHARIGRERRRLESRRQTAERALIESDRAEEHKQTGELLLANLWRIQPGDAETTVQNYYDSELPERTIPLDVKLTPQENAEAYFRRYRKARDGQETALEFGAKTETALTRLEIASERLEASATEAQVRALHDELLAEGLLHRQEETEEGGEGTRGPDFQGHKIRRYTTPEGYEIYIGETATANDFLTTRLASPNDLWLHVRAAAGSHVIIRTRGKPESIPRAVLERAALLCAQHSAQKHASLVSVDYTLRKYVRKPRGSAPGSVDYEREKTLDVTP